MLVYYKDTDTILINKKHIYGTFFSVIEKMCRLYIDIEFYWDNRTLHTVETLIIHSTVNLIAQNDLHFVRVTK